MNAKPTVNPRHLSGSTEWYTPAPVLACVRQALGGYIDLDPASTAEANETVQATRFYTKEDDGLLRPWHGTVFLNPPGGKLGSESSQKLWWRHLAYEWTRGRVTAAIFLSFSVEFFQTSQVKPQNLPTPHDFPICFPSRRIAYQQAGSTSFKSPPHSSALIYLGPSPALFAEAMRPLGRRMGPLVLPASSIH